MDLLIVIGTMILALTGCAVALWSLFGDKPKGKDKR